MPTLREDGITEYSYEETKEILDNKRYKYFLYTAHSDLWFTTKACSLKEGRELVEFIEKGQGSLWTVYYQDTETLNWIVPVRTIIAINAIDVTPKE